MRPGCFRTISKTRILTIQRNDTQLVYNTTQSTQSSSFQLISPCFGVASGQNKFGSGGERGTPGKDNETEGKGRRVPNADSLKRETEGNKQEREIICFYSI